MAWRVTSHSTSNPTEEEIAGGVSADDFYLSLILVKSNRRVPVNRAGPLNTDMTQQEAAQVLLPALADAKTAAQAAADDEAAEKVVNDFAGSLVQAIEDYLNG